MYHTAYPPPVRALIETLAHQLAAGHPHARTRLQTLLLPLVWLSTMPKRSDPTPSEITDAQQPRLGPAFMALQDALALIESGHTPRPKKGKASTYFIWAANKIAARRVRREFEGDEYATREMARLFGPSAQTIRRQKQTNKQHKTNTLIVEEDHDMPLDRCIDPSTDDRSYQLSYGHWLDDAREQLDGLDISHRDRQVIRMLSDGYRTYQIAVALTISVRTVLRVRDRISQMVKQAG